MIEDQFLPDLSLENPVRGAARGVARHHVHASTVPLTDGRHLSAVQLQWEYFEHAKKYVEREDDTPENREVLTRWEAVLSALETEPLTLHRELDWVAKYRLLAAYRERDGLDVERPEAPGDRPPVPRRPPRTRAVLPARARRARSSA